MGYAIKGREIMMSTTMVLTSERMPDKDGIYSAIGKSGIFFPRMDYTVEHGFNTSNGHYESMIECLAWGDVIDTWQLGDDFKEELKNEKISSDDSDAV